MFSLLNLLLVLIISVVIFVHIIMTHQKFSKIEQSITSKNFLDLAEFAKLNKEFKQNYKTYVVDRVMPHVMNEANIAIKNSGINESVKMNKQEINTAIDSLPYLMQQSRTANTNTKPVVKEEFGSYSKW